MIKLRLSVKFLNNVNISFQAVLRFLEIVFCRSECYVQASKLCTEEDKRYYFARILW